MVHHTQVHIHLRTQSAEPVKDLRHPLHGNAGIGRDPDHLGFLLRDPDLKSAVEKAVSFVTATIEKAVEMQIPVTDGLPFEETLPMLWS
jgi:hypothetical protein